MSQRAGWCLGWLLCVACGGIAEQPGGQTPSAGAGGQAPTPNLGGNADSGGSAGNSETEPACPFSIPSCGVMDSYIDIADAPAVRLGYPLDPSCGTCGAASCELWANGLNGCGLSLSLAACSKPNGTGACLDTASASPYYRDGSGTFYHVQLVSNAFPSEVNGLLELDVKLELSGGPAARELAAHLHLCALITPVFVVCK